ncbi:GntR family transcriptional regulator [Sphingosinicella terrae]|uniref:GntR family transcriptional regulator n=1 Tax=Sphingosinicella terrae TaxID=2172047 RepID=UPI0013B38DCC|nr:GntR family transcriptional regulator [Sphingosinicella terrae]
MSPGPTFERVYQALKQRLLEGAFAPGAHLEPAAIGAELTASITPVRDALHRLVGERLVESPRHNGFVVPSPTEAQLRDLYGWNGSLVVLALRRSVARESRRPPPLPPSRRMPGEGATMRAPCLFHEIVRAAGSAEHRDAIERMNDRLACVRRVEAQVLAGLAEEEGSLTRAWRESDLRMLAGLVRAYHRRRQRQAPELLEALRTTSTSLG